MHGLFLYDIHTDDKDQYNYHIPSHSLAKIIAMSNIDPRCYGHTSIFSRCLISEVPVDKT